MERACGDRASQLFLASSVAATYSADVCGGLVSARFSSWCGGAVWRVERVSSVYSLTILVVVQKKVADYTYRMGIERRNLTSWSSSGVYFGTRNATDGISSRRTQMRMYVYTRSTFLSKVGPSFGGAARTQTIILKWP